MRSTRGSRAGATRRRCTCSTCRCSSGSSRTRSGFTSVRDGRDAALSFLALPARASPGRRGRSRAPPRSSPHGGSAGDRRGAGARARTWAAATSSSATRISSPSRRASWAGSASTRPCPWEPAMLEHAGEIDISNSRARTARPATNRGRPGLAQRDAGERRARVRAGGGRRARRRPATSCSSRARATRPSAGGASSPAFAALCRSWNLTAIAFRARRSGRRSHPAA